MQKQIVFSVLFPSNFVFSGRFHAITYPPRRGGMADQL
jgi:hypothetical protein